MADGGGSPVVAPPHQDRHAVMTQAHYQPPPTNTQPARGYDMTCQFYFLFLRTSAKLPVP